MVVLKWDRKNLINEGAAWFRSESAAKSGITR